MPPLFMIRLGKYGFAHWGDHDVLNLYCRNENLPLQFLLIDSTMSKNEYYG